MKFWIILIVQTTTFTLFSQEEPKAHRPLYIGAFYSADFTKGNYEGGFGYSAGLNLMGEISPRFTFDIGLHYSSVGIRRENITLGSSLNPATGTFDTTYTLKQKYRFLELPVKVSYSFFKSHRISTFLTAGILPNYLLKTRTSYETNPSSGGEMQGDPFPETYSYNTFGFGGIIGFGIGINITDRLALNFQPEYRIYFTSNGLSAIGLNSGVIYKL